MNYYKFNSKRNNVAKVALIDDVCCRKKKKFQKLFFIHPFDPIILYFIKFHVLLLL